MVLEAIEQKGFSVHPESQINVKWYWENIIFVDILIGYKTHKCDLLKEW
jgi:hypothetical protein